MNGKFTILEFFENMFKEPYLPKKSLNITFENISNTKELFEMLYNIFIKGMNIKFGKNDIIDIKKIDDKSFDEFKKYFESIGIRINCDIFHISQLTLIDNLDYELLNYLHKNYSPLVKNNLPSYYSKNISKNDLINYKYETRNKLEYYKNQVFAGDNIYVIYFTFI